VLAGRKKKQPLSEKDLSRWKLIADFQARLESAGGAEAQGSFADPRRQLSQSDYLSLLLFGLFNPVVESMRGLCAASQLAGVQEEVCSHPVSLVYRFIKTYTEGGASAMVGNMAGKSKLQRLVLTPEEKQRLEGLRASRSASVREVERAQILLRFQSGENPSAIHRALRLSRVTIYNCLHKALAMGVEAGLKDAFHRPKEPMIERADKAWVVHLACTKPKELGYAAELWTRSALATHVRQNAQSAGHPSLRRAAKSTVQRILAEQALQPHKVKYYLEKRDPEFEAKMKEVLMVYQEGDAAKPGERAGGAGRRERRSDHHGVDR